MWVVSLVGSAGEVLCATVAEGESMMMHSPQHELGTLAAVMVPACFVAVTWHWGYVLEDMMQPWILKNFFFHPLFVAAVAVVKVFVLLTVVIAVVVVVADVLKVY